MVQKRETKAINKLCVREILSLSFVCGAYFFEFRGRNLVCFGIALLRLRWQIRAGRREGTHAHCVFFSLVQVIWSVSLGTKPLVDSTRHFIRAASGVFFVGYSCECYFVQ